MNTLAPLHKSREIKGGRFLELSMAPSMTGDIAGIMCMLAMLSASFSM
jgi:hypothetical protein